MLRAVMDCPARGTLLTFFTFITVTTWCGSHVRPQKHWLFVQMTKSWLLIIRFTASSHRVQCLGGFYSEVYGLEWKSLHVTEFSCCRFPSTVSQFRDPVPHQELRVRIRFASFCFALWNYKRVDVQPKGMEMFGRMSIDWWVDFSFGTLISDIYCCLRDNQ